MKPPKFDFSAEIQNFFEYFYPLSFNADFQKFIAEITFTPSYLELWYYVATPLSGAMLLMLVICLVCEFPTQFLRLVPYRDWS